MTMSIRNYSQEIEPDHKTREEEENSVPIKMIENIQNKLLIKKIKHRMFNIEQCYFNPQILTICGYDQIRSTPGQHWKSRIYTLFCDAYLPHYWILDIWKSRKTLNTSFHIKIPALMCMINPFSEQCFTTL